MKRINKEHGHINKSRDKMFAFVVSTALLSILTLIFQNCANSDLVIPEVVLEEPVEEEVIINRIDDSRVATFGAETTFELDSSVPSDTVVSWFLNDQEIAGQEGLSLTIEGLNYSSQGTYQARDINGEVLLESVLVVEEAQSCKHILEFTRGAASGNYDIDPDLDGAEYNTLAVNCDMSTAGGGWTEITIQQARNVFKGQMRALQAAPMAGFDGEDRPFTRDLDLNAVAGGTDNHGYHYDFQIPFGYAEFYTSNYQAQSNAAGGQTTDIRSGDFINTVWNTLFSATSAVGGVGDISLGSPLNSGPATSFARGFSVDVNTLGGQLVSFPRNNMIFQVSGTPVNQFRIAWGDRGREAEGWKPWFSGTIFFR